MRWLSHLVFITNYDCMIRELNMGTHASETEEETGLQSVVWYRMLLE